MSFPRIKGSDIFKNTEFYKWLMSKHEEQVKYDSFITAIRTYTGYVDAPFKNRDDGQYHKWAYEAFLQDIRPKSKFINIY